MVPKDSYPAPLLDRLRFRMRENSIRIEKLASVVSITATKTPPEKQTFMF